MNKQFKKGFTLIELLVVIAVIALLTAIVLASLSSAKSRGADANIKATLKGIQSQANLYFSNYGDFGIAANSCATAGSIFTNVTTYGLSKLVTAAQAKTTVVCGASGAPATTWSVSAQSKANPAQFMCVDSAGAFKIMTEGTPPSRSACLES